MTTDTARKETPPPPPERVRGAKPARKEPTAQPPGERGGPKGPEPTRFGDWEKNGRCFDF
ncbi:MAG: DUF1674 domain-containing protein [Pseudomonadota bacterium]